MEQKVTLARAPLRTFPETERPLDQVVELALANNRLLGEIPTTIASLVDLERLDAIAHEQRHDERHGDHLAGRATKVGTGPPDQPLLADLERALPRLLQSRHLPFDETGSPAVSKKTTAGSDADGEGEWAGRPPRAGMSAAMDPSLLAIDPDLVTEWLVRFLRDEMLERRGFEHAVIGLSGGVDSALTAAL